MYNFISGAVMMGCAVTGLFFLRFWVQTRDPLFQIFALAFWILGIERLIPVLGNFYDEPRTFIYAIRLVAFALILYAIVEKNRQVSK